MQQISNGQLLTPMDYKAFATQFMLKAVAVTKDQEVWIEHLGERSQQLCDACTEAVIDV